MNDLVKEVEEYSIDDLELILSTQMDLYSDEEIAIIKAQLDKKNKLKENEEIENLPNEIKCSKCDMMNSFENEKCDYSECKLDKSKYYSDDYYDTEYVEESNDYSSDNNSYTFQYVISFIIPLVGFILGAILLAKDDEYERSCGKTCIVLGIVSTLISVVVLTLY